MVQKLSKSTLRIRKHRVSKTHSVTKKDEACKKNLHVSFFLTTFASANVTENVLHLVDEQVNFPVVFRKQKYKLVYY